MSNFSDCLHVYFPKRWISGYSSMLIALLIFTSGRNSGFEGFEPYCFYVLSNFFIILSWPVRVLGVSASVERKARFWLGLFFVKISFLAGNKFSNSKYKVTSGSAENLLNCRSNLKIAHSTSISSPVGSTENFCYPFTCVMCFMTATFTFMLAGAQSTFSHTPNFRN